MLQIKFLSILLILLAVSFATAPAWVTTGASVNYTQGSNTISFTVTGRTSSVVDVLLKTSSPASNASTTENASADSNEFWLDNSLLGAAYTGENLNNLIVTAIGPQSIAGQSWTAVTLQGTEGGTEVTQIFDQQTGLLLKQSATSQPDVILSQYYLPGITPTQSQTPPPQQTNQSNTTPPPSNSQNSTANSTGNSTPPPTTTPPSTGNTGQPYQPPSPTGDQTQTSTSTSSSSLPCCPSSFILLLVGFVAIKDRF